MPQLLSPRATTTEACAPRACAPQQEKPPLAATRESPHAATKTQHSQKKEKKRRSRFHVTATQPRRKRNDEAVLGLSWPSSVSLLSLIQLPANLGFVPPMPGLISTMRTLLYFLDPLLGTLPHVSRWLPHLPQSGLSSEAHIPRELSPLPTPTLVTPYPSDSPSMDPEQQYQPELGAC